MTSIATGKDRRQHKRYDIASGGFALLHSKDNEVIGSIKDISTSGFCLSHIDGNEEINEHSMIAINLVNKCYNH